MPQNPVATTLFVSQFKAGAGIVVTPAHGTGVVTVSAGGSPAVDNITASKTLSTTNPATLRDIYGKITLNYAGIVTIGSGSGSVAGVRGEIDGAAGTTLGDGFYYGVQGKFILGGATIAEVSAARYCGVIAQLDVSAGTMTSGQLSALWADMGASAAGAFPTESYIIRASNTTAQAVNGHLFSYGKANYWAVIDDNGSGFVTTGAATPSGAMKKVKVNIDGTDLYVLAAAVWS